MSFLDYNGCVPDNFAHRLDVPGGRVLQHSGLPAGTRSHGGYDGAVPTHGYVLIPDYIVKPLRIHGPDRIKGHLVLPLREVLGNIMGHVRGGDHDDVLALHCAANRLPQRDSGVVVLEPHADGDELELRRDVLQERQLHLDRVLVLVRLIVQVYQILSQGLRKILVDLGHSQRGLEVLDRDGQPRTAPRVVRSDYDERVGQAVLCDPAVQMRGDHSRVNVACMRRHTPHDDPLAFLDLGEFAWAEGPEEALLDLSSQTGLVAL